MQSSETRYSLRIETGERQGETMPLHEGLATLGRRSDNTLVLPYGSVSGRHAEIRVSNGHVELNDLGSTNGTKVSGRKVDTVDLSHGDEIALGSFKLRLLDGQLGEIDFEPSDELEIEIEEPDKAPLDEPGRVPAQATPASPDRLDSLGGPTESVGELKRLSAEKVAASGSKSRLGLLALGVIVALAVAYFSWSWQQRKTAGGAQAAAVVEEEGNLLAGGSFEEDAAELDWSSPETAQGFLLERKFARTGRVGLGAELEQNEWALARSPRVELASSAASKALRLSGSLRTTGGVEGRLGLEFATSASGEGAVFVWAPALGPSELGFNDCEARFNIPPGYRHVRYVVAARGTGEVALDDAGLFEAERDDALDTNYNEIELRVLGQDASTAALVRAGRCVLPSLQLGRWDTKGLAGASQASWSASRGERGFEVSFKGSPKSLAVVVSDNGIDLGSDDQAWIASIGASGYRGHGLQFERTQVHSVFLGRGTELLRLGFEHEVTVRGEAHPSGLALFVTLNEASGMALQLSFVEERTEATVLVSLADEAERRGRVGEALAAWSQLLDEYPIERSQVKRAEEARARLIGEGLDEVAAVRAAFERARFFALPELYRQGRERCRLLSGRYRGSEVDAEATKLDAEIEGELEKASTGGLAQESELLEDVLKALDPKNQPKLIDHLRQALTRRESEDSQGGGVKEEGTDG